MPAEPLLRALKHVWLTLEPLRFPMAVMGGIAVAASKHVRATQDVELLVGVGASESARILERLGEAGVRPKRQPPVLALGAFQII